MKYNLIPDRIAYASKVDASQCPDVLNFIQEKANYEAFLEWARKPEKRELRDEIFYPVPKQSFMRRFISPLTP